MGQEVNVQKCQENSIANENESFWCYAHPSTMVSGKSLSVGHRDTCYISREIHNTPVDS